MKKVLLLVPAVLLIFAAAAFSASTGGVGYVDTSRALNESNPGKKAKADLEEFIKSRRAELESKSSAIEKAKADLEKQESILSQEAKKSKAEDIERLIRDYQRLVVDAQNDVKKREMELTKGIITAIKAAIDKLGQQSQYALIIDGSDNQILYGKKDADLTDSVIKMLNQ